MPTSSPKSHDKSPIPFGSSEYCRKATNAKSAFTAETERSAETLNLRGIGIRTRIRFAFSPMEEGADSASSDAAPSSAQATPEPVEDRLSRMLRALDRAESRPG